MNDAPLTSAEALATQRTATWAVVGALLLILPILAFAGISERYHHGAPLVLAEVEESGVPSPIKSVFHPISENEVFDPPRHSDFLVTYCIRCHDGADSSAGLDLRKLLKPDSHHEHRELWESSLEAIDQQRMPPADESNRMPLTDEVEQLVEWYAATSTPQSPTTFRRLNRSEYERSICDLFLLNPSPFENPEQIVLNEQYFRPESGEMPEYVLVFNQLGWRNRKTPELPGLPLLPMDPPAEHGFDTNAEQLSFSPLHLETSLAVNSALIHHPEFRFISGNWKQIFEIPDHDLAGDETRLRALAKRRLQDFLTRAFRRPIPARELSRWSTFFDQQLRNGEAQSKNSSDNFTKAMQTTIEAVLASPHFQFRFDLAEKNDLGKDYEIASRLSYFLWSSLPDERLLMLASQNGFTHISRVNGEPEFQPCEQNTCESNLRQQVRRMLSDPRSKTLSIRFGSQWLDTRRAIASKPDPGQFPAYYQSVFGTPLAVFMAVEQMLLFETIQIENRSILDFIDADFAYLNRALMDWYGINAQEALGFQPEVADVEDYFRIQWPSRMRGGVLTSGATLVGTSLPSRTSPVSRGVWILNTIFNDAPSPPPAATPALAASGKSADVSIRERLKRHRTDPGCASCHAKIDPIGFSLEQFDPVGRIHHSNETRFDAIGTYESERIDGAIGLKNLILKRQHDFAIGFTEKLLEYALGRSLGLADKQAARRIAETARASNYRFHTLVEEVAVHIASHR